VIRARSGLRQGLATVAAIAATVAFPATAPAAVTGATTLVLNGPAAKDLRAVGVGIVPLRPAHGGKGKVVLPVAAGLAGAETTLLRHRGGLLLRSPAGVKLRIAELRLVLDKRARLSARMGGRDVELFAVLGKRRGGVDASAGSVDLAGLRLRLTRAGARAIAAGLVAGARQSHLGEEHPPAEQAHPPAIELQPGRFGTLSSRASGLIASGKVAGTEKGGAGASSGCPLPSGAGPAPEDPLPVATRPAGASDISGATVGWHVRESFIRYIATGEGTSVSGGASADPPVLLPGASVPLSYDFRFPFAGGWHDAGANLADPADDRAAIHFGGALRFLYSGHEIDLGTSSPEIELGGGASRAIFAVSEKGGGASRQVLVNLDLGRAAAIAVQGNTHTYERVPGAIPAGTASSVFGGFYAPGTDFGCFTVTYTTS
jgi:Htaa protein